MVEVALVILGLCAGSFVNALVWRLHEKKDWIKARSQCTHCHHELAATDLIPVLSWLYLMGRCRYCHKKISMQYPLVEVLVAFLFFIAYELWPNRLNGTEIVVFVLWLLVTTGLVALAIYDTRWMILPSKLIYVLLGLALVMAVMNIVLAGNHVSTLLEYLFAVLIGGGLFYVLFVVSNGKWIGGGDVRLGFLLGIVAATAQKSFLLIFIAALIGCLVAIPLMAQGKLKKSSTIPFGPFLIMAAFIVQFAGSNILDWYRHIFLGT